MAKVKNTYHIADMYHQILQKHPLQYKHQFIIEFIAPVGQTGSIFDGDEAFGRKDHTSIDSITYWGQSASIPEQTINSAKINFLANEFEVPGVVKFGDNWSIKLLLDQELTQYKKLEAWQNYISDFSKSGGGRKVIPNVQAKVSLLDASMQNITNSFILEGVWINKLGNIAFQYESGGAGIPDCTATFSYQYFYPADDLEQPTASDPLSPTALDVIADAASIFLK